MLVKVMKQDFQGMDDASLIWTCIEPTIRQIRGKSFFVKKEVSAQLNAGQRALLMFQMFYGHSGNGVIELFNHLSYLLSQKGVWSELKNGVRYFGDTDMILLLDELEEVYDILKENTIKADSKLQLIIDRLDRQIFEMTPPTVKIVGAYIRNHPYEFVEYIQE